MSKLIESIKTGMLYITGALSIVLVFITPWKYDDGWTLLTVNNYLDTGLFSYVIYYNNIQYTFQKFWFWLLSLVVRFSDEIYVARLPALIFALMSTYFLFKATAFINRKLGNINPFAVFFWIYSTYTFLITMRAEPILIAMLSIILYLTLRSLAEQKSSHLLYGYIPAVIAISSHPNGIYIYCCQIYFGLIVLIRTREYSSPKLIVVWLLSTVASVLIAIKLVLWNLSISEFIDLLNIVANEETHNKSYKYEGQRYDEMWVIDSAYAALLFGIIIISIAVFLIGWLARSVQSKQMNELLINYFLIIIVPLNVLLIYLLFYPAKWYHYFSLTVPYLFISVHFWDRFFPVKAKLTSTLALGLVLILSIITLTKAVYVVLGQNQYSYLKAALFNQKYEFNLTTAGHQPVIYLDPYIVPFFKNIKIQPLDNFESKPDYIISSCGCADYFMKKFNDMALIKNVIKFDFEGKKVDIYIINKN